LPHLPRPQRCETLRRNARSVQGVRKCEARGAYRFIGELKSAVMMGERIFCATIDQCSHCLVGVHVVIAHEPAWLISTNRQNSQFKRAMAVACAAKIPPPHGSQSQRQNKFAHRAFR
jgi:hypothetical protein